MSWTNVISFFQTITTCLSLVQILYNNKSSKTVSELKNQTTTTKIQNFLNESEKILSALVNNNTEYPNTNIESVVYDNEKMKEVITEENNSIEMRWKSNILFMNTPVGNIVMCYDIFKHGFIYYADFTISYEILNAVAIKYVKKFCCLDFFVDEYSIELNSSLLKMWKEEQLKEIDEKNNKIKKVLGHNNHELFVKPKKTNINSDIYKVPEIEKKRNKFIYLGKINNFHFLQHKTLKQSVNTKPISYGDFKRIQMTR